METTGERGHVTKGGRLGRGETKVPNLYATCVARIEDLDYCCSLRVAWTGKACAGGGDAGELEERGTPQYDEEPSETNEWKKKPFGSKKKDWCETVSCLAVQKQRFSLSAWFPPDLGEGTRGLEANVVPPCREESVAPHPGKIPLLDGGGGVETRSGFATENKIVMVTSRKVPGEKSRLIGIVGKG